MTDTKYIFVTYYKNSWYDIMEGPALQEQYLRCYWLFITALIYFSITVKF